MAINMKPKQFDLLFIIITIFFMKSVSQEHMSTENINNILDKLIQQTTLNETAPNMDLMDTFMPMDDGQPGNDSNIYYFKTYMAPRINYKSGNEVVHLSQRSNRTIQSLEVANEDRIAMSEESFPVKLSRKSIMEMDNQKHGNPRFMYNTINVPYQEHKTRDDFENEAINDLLKKEIVANFNTVTDNKQISFTQRAQPNPDLNLLHNYPEIIIDHVTYDNDEPDEGNDNAFNDKLIKVKETHDAENVHNVVNGNNNVKSENPVKPNLRTRFNIPEEEINRESLPSETYETKNYLTPDMKALLEAIVQKQVVHDTLIKQTTESESRKQNILLEKILQRLPDQKPMNNNVKLPYSVRPDLESRMAAPIEMEPFPPRVETLQRNVGHRITKQYLNVPPALPNKWEMHNRLRSALLRMSKTEALKRTRLVARLIEKIMSNIDYNPRYYDIFKK